MGAEIAQSMKGMNWETVNNYTSSFKKMIAV